MEIKLQAICSGVKEAGDSVAGSGVEAGVPPIVLVRYNTSTPTPATRRRTNKLQTAKNVLPFFLGFVMRKNFRLTFKS